jgi:hypothetical protein
LADPRVGATDGKLEGSGVVGLELGMGAADGISVSPLTDRALPAKWPTLTMAIVELRYDPIFIFCVYNDLYLLLDLSLCFCEL